MAPPAWLEAFRLGSATLMRPVAPVLVLIDAQYDGPCPVSWQEGYIAAIEKLGGEISSSRYPNDDHFSLPHSSIQEARECLTARFS